METTAERKKKLTIGFGRPSTIHLHNSLAN